MPLIRQHPANVWRAGLRLAAACALGVAACGGDADSSEDTAGHPAGSAALDRAGSSAAEDRAAGSSGMNSAGAAGALEAAGSGGAAGMANVAARDGGSVGEDAGMAGAPGTAGTSSTGANNGCLDGITDYASAGPFEFQAVQSGMVKLWVPNVPSDCKVPIVHFANGTVAQCQTYLATLEHLASHGFLVTCYESGQTGEGTQCVTAIETALAEYPDLADMKVGSGGQGTGGGSALLCTHYVHERWGDAMQVVAHGSEPDLAGLAGGWKDIYGQLDSPVFLFNGSQDMLVSEGSVRMQWDALSESIEAHWLEGMGAAHIPLPFSWINESMVAWFRWQLLDDAAACEHVSAMPDSSDWDLQERRNPSDC